MQQAFAPRSQGPLNTALRHLARFARTCPTRTLFYNPDESKSYSAHNEWTLILFATNLATQRSSKTGQPMRAATIESYVSIIKGYFSTTYAFELTDKSPRLKRLLRYMHNDGDASTRKKRRGWRRRNFVKWYATLSNDEKKSVEVVCEHAACATAWHTLARGGEIAPDLKAGVQWTPECGPSRADLKFHKGRDGSRYAILWLRPLKKRSAGPQPKVPQYITEHDGGGSDTYTALKRYVKADPVPAQLAASTPLFRKQTARGAWAPIKITDLRKTVRKMAAKIGYTDTKEWGAHSFRIGGASDLAATGEASQLLLQAKGRWSSDIGKIYARMTRRCQLAGSRLMQRAQGKDLEEIFPQYTQAA